MERDIRFIADKVSLTLMRCVFIYNAKNNYRTSGIFFIFNIEIIAIVLFMLMFYLKKCCYDALWLVHRV